MSNTPKFSVGETVIYYNGYGINMGQRKITAIETEDDGFRYYISPTDTPWYSIREKNLRKIKK